MLSALEYIHSVGCLHRDVKPENFIFEDGRMQCVKLIDFGCACYVGNPPGGKGGGKGLGKDSLESHSGGGGGGSGGNMKI